MRVHTHTHTHQNNNPAPLMVKAEEMQEVFNGTTAELKCNVTSFPDPTVIWFRFEGDGDSTSDATELEEQDEGENGVYVYRIENAGPSDAGLYRCQGRFPFGRESVDIELVILCKLLQCS